MISKSVFDSISAEVLAEMAKEYDFNVNYQEFKALWKQVEEINTKKEQYANKKSPELNVAYLFVIRWGLAALSIFNESAHKPEAFLYQSIFTSISNTTYAIIKLAIEGFDYQANVLLRNLLELNFTLLNVAIDSDKLFKLLNAHQDNKEYAIWKQHFTFAKLVQTINTYLSSKPSDDNIDFLYERFNEWYKHYSSYVHNDFLSMFAYNMQLPEGEDELLHINLWGHYASRDVILMGNMNSILWISNAIFMNILGSKETNDVETLVSDERKEFWRSSVFLSLFTNRYYFNVMMDKEGEG